MQYSTGDIRDRMATRERLPPENVLQQRDAFLAAVVDELHTGYPCVQVHIFDLDERHIGIVDRDEHAVNAGTLDFLRKCGFYVTHAGVEDKEYPNDIYEQHATAEFREHPQPVCALLRRFHADAVVDPTDPDINLTEHGDCR
jgi:hypothetical protein